MPSPKGKLKICDKGHRFYKSSSCPVCPICARQEKPADDLLSRLYAPARRALSNAGITTTTQLAAYTEAEILKLHGMGKASLPALRQALKEAGLNFKK